MFHTAGSKVLYLKRLSMGSLILDEALKPGECRELTQKEVESLKTGDAGSVYGGRSDSRSLE